MVMSQIPIVVISWRILPLQDEKEFDLLERFVVQNYGTTLKELSFQNDRQQTTVNTSKNKQKNTHTLLTHTRNHNGIAFIVCLQLFNNLRTIQ